MDPSRQIRWIRRECRKLLRYVAGGEVQKADALLREKPVVGQDDWPLASHPR